VVDEHQAGAQLGVQVQRFHIASVFLWPGMLQQLLDDQADALHLFVQ